MKKIAPEHIKRGDVLYVEFQFDDMNRAKLRPAVVTNINQNSIFLTKISSQINQYPLNYTLKDWHTSGLRKPSQVQCNRHNIIKRDGIKSFSKIGELTERDLKNVLEQISSINQEKYNSHSEKRDYIKEYCEKKNPTQHKHEKGIERNR